jgi:hypothetical protein
LAHIGYGYGSEWHLLYELGRRRDAFTREVERATGCSGIQWLDHEEALDDTSGQLKVSEPRGLGFIAASNPVRQEWEQRWPQSGNVHNWDAVGHGVSGERESWILLEAKAHIGELASACTATAPESIKRIGAVLEDTKRALVVPDHADWTRGYYQYSNRLGLLYFLTTRGVAAHLVFVYFVGDRMDLGRGGRECPATEQEWHEALANQDRHVALPPSSSIRERVHRLFLPAHRANIAEQVLRPEYCRSAVVMPSTNERQGPPIHMSSTALTRAFDDAMNKIYVDAKKAGYHATRFLQMLGDHGGVDTAHRLLPSMSDGFTELWKRNRLDLTVESLVLQREWHELFSDDERKIARQRLRECGVDVQP